MSRPVVLDVAPRALPMAVADAGKGTRRALRILNALFATCRSEHTRRAYVLDLTVFRRFLEMGYGQRFSPAQVIDRLLWGGRDGHTHAGHAHELADYYAAWLETHGKSSATIRRQLATLKAVVKAARRLGLLSWTLEMRAGPPQPVRSTAGPGASVIAAILATLATDTSPLAIRNTAILRLLYDVALRRGEVAGLDMGDLDLAHRRIRIKGKSRSAKEWINIPAPTADAVNAWLRLRGTDAGPVFVTLTARGAVRTRRERLSGHGIYKLVRDYGLEQGVKTWPHGLRHSSITEAVKAAGPAGIDITEVLQFSRHRRLDTLMIYRDRLRDVQGTLAAAVATTVVTHQPDTHARPRTAPSRLRLTLADE